MSSVSKATNGPTAKSVQRARRLCWAAALLSAAPALGQAPPPPIATDRPSESASAGIVPLGSVQFELGYKGTRDTDTFDQPVDTQTLPDLLIRVGLSTALEARFTTAGWSLVDRDSGSEDGFNDVAVGFKWAFDAGADRPTHVSLLADVTIPVGEPGFTSEFASPKLLLLVDHSLSDRLGVTANAGVSVLKASETGSGSRTVTELPYTALAAYSVGESTSVFGELYGALGLQGLDDRHLFQAGVTARIAPRWQLDARAGVGLVADVSDWTVGVGLSFRLRR